MARIIRCCFVLFICFCFHSALVFVLTKKIMLMMTRNTVPTFPQNPRAMFTQFKSKMWDLFSLQDFRYVIMNITSKLEILNRQSSRYITIRYLSIWKHVFFLLPNILYLIYIFLYIFNSDFAIRTIMVYVFLISIIIQLLHSDDLYRIFDLYMYAINQVIQRQKLYS